MSYGYRRARRQQRVMLGFRLTLFILFAILFSFCVFIAKEALDMDRVKKALYKKPTTTIPISTTTTTIPYEPKTNWKEMVE